MENVRVELYKLFRHHLSAAHLFSTGLWPGDRDRQSAHHPVPHRRRGRRSCSVPNHVTHWQAKTPSLERSSPEGGRNRADLSRRSGPPWLYGHGAYRGRQLYLDPAHVRCSHGTGGHDSRARRRRLFADYFLRICRRAGRSRPCRYPQRPHKLWFCNLYLHHPVPHRPCGLPLHPRNRSSGKKRQKSRRPSPSRKQRLNCFALSNAIKQRKEEKK